MSAGNEERKDIGGRESLFEAPPYAVYLPPGTKYAVEASTKLKVAVASAPAERGVDPIMVRPSEWRFAARAIWSGRYVRS